MELFISLAVEYPQRSQRPLACHSGTRKRVARPLAYKPDLENSVLTFACITVKNVGTSNNNKACIDVIT